MSNKRNNVSLWLTLPALFLLSFAVLTFEVALTRIFSVMLSYHFVFAIVSAALLGLGIGAMALKRLRGDSLQLPVSRSSLIFALLTAGSVLAIVKLPSVPAVGFWLYLILAVLPFAAAGFAVSGVFQMGAGTSSLLYGADMLGAAVGAFTVVPVLDGVGGVNAVLIAAAVAGLGSLPLSWRRGRVPWAAAAVFGALAALAAAVTGSGMNVSVPITNDPNKEMYTMLSNPAYKARIVQSRWSSFGRTDLVKSERFPNEMTLYVDGAAGSVMYRAEAILNDPEEMSHLTFHYGEFFPFLTLKEEDRDSALIIGPGGGRDVVVALLGGVRKITAVEVNPDIVKIVKEYGQWNGMIYSGNPRVTTVVAEGRNFVRASTDLYDLIMLALPITKSSRSVEGYALTENYLFTVEAFQDYFRHLTPNGRMIIVAHGDPEIYRLIALVTAALARSGVSEQDAMKRLYTVAGDMMPALVVQNRALTPEEGTVIHEKVHALGYDKGALYVPYEKQVTIPAGTRLGVDKEFRMFDRFLVDVSEGKLSIATLVRTASLDISPVTDDGPFFYKFERGLPAPFGVFSFLIIAGAAALGVLLLFRRGSVRPDTFRGALREHPALKRFLLLFSALGVGFMLVEISFFQKLMLFLGQPQMALTVLLFSLLLGGGLGSLLSALTRRSPTRTAAVISLGVALAVALLSALFQRLFGLFAPPRLTAMVILVPLGVLMGFGFPVGLRAMEMHGLGTHVSRMWGVNGIASVLGSALAMIVGIVLGFSWALYLGAALYVGAAALLFSLGRGKPASS